MVINQEPAFTPWGMVPYHNFVVLFFMLLASLSKPIPPFNSIRSYVMLVINSIPLHFQGSDTDKLKDKLYLSSTKKVPKGQLRAVLVMESGIEGSRRFTGSLCYPKLLLKV